MDSLFEPHKNRTITRIKIIRVDISKSQNCGCLNKLVQSIGSPDITVGFASSIVYEVRVGPNLENTDLPGIWQRLLELVFSQSIPISLHSINKIRPNFVKSNHIASQEQKEKCDYLQNEFMQ